MHGHSEQIADSATVAGMVSSVVADADTIQASTEMPTRAAGILFVTPEDEILLLMRGAQCDFPGAFGLPAGKVESGEDLQACARRECLEETGLNYAGELKQISDDGNFCAFMARVDKFDVTLCDESAGYVWVKRDQIPVNAHPGLANVLRIAFADTELCIAELMRDGVLPSPQIYANILLVDLRITGTGMAFRGGIGEHVYRDPSLYLNTEFLSRCNGLPVILDHPDEIVLNAKEFENRISGTCMLPYIKGDEVWAIAKIYAADAIAALTSGEDISTSPCVVFGEDSENVKVLLENGSPLLIEGKPVLIDHIALVSQARGGLGVWDKGGPAAGVNLQNEGFNMTDEEKKAAADAAEKAKADADEKAKADADGGQKIDKVLAAIDSMSSRMDAMGKRMDSMESKKDAKADEDKDGEEKKKADAEEKAKADAECEEKAKADSAKKDEESAMFADAQARADRVYAAFGDSAPRPLQGETLMAYRRRLISKHKAHSPMYKGINLGAIGDSAVLAIAETQIFADAYAAARSPADVAEGHLVEIKNSDRAGRTISEFRGMPDAWMRQFKFTRRHVIGINKGK